MAKKRVNVPNILTATRIVLGPCIGYFILASYNMAAFILFAAAVFTDAADGYIARNYRQATKLGAAMDYLADKILFAFVLFPLMIKNDMIAWAAVFFVTGIILLVGNRFFVKKNMKVSIVGKVCTGLEAAVLGIMIYGFVNQALAILLALLFTIPALHYLIIMRKR